MRRAWVILAASVVVLLPGAPPPAAFACGTQVGSPAPHPCPRAPSLAAYRGLATWVDVYDSAQWAAPGAAVARMHALGVHTLFLEVPFGAGSAAVGSASAVDAFLTAAHARGMAVVAWWVPDFTSPALDVRRGEAAIAFRSPAGQRFDSLGVDIERSTVRPVALRNYRVASELALIRRSVGTSFPISAIIPAPRGIQLAGAYWPGFPYRPIAQNADIFVPMGYYTNHTSSASGAYAYTVRNADILWAALGRRFPVHMIGGAAGSSSPAQVQSFVRACTDLRLTGCSLYDYATTGPAAWPLMRGVPGA